MAEFVISHGCGYVETQQHASSHEAVEFTGQMYQCPGCGYDDYDIVWNVEEKPQPAKEDGE